MTDPTPLIDVHRHLEAAPAAEDLAPLVLKHGIDLPRWKLLSETPVSHDFPLF